MKKATIITIVIIIILLIIGTVIFLAINDPGVEIGSPRNDALPSMCKEDTANCEDFPSQEAAQSVYDTCIQFDVGDIHQLDNDGDGIACESLPAE